MRCAADYAAWRSAPSSLRRIQIPAADCRPLSLARLRHGSCRCRQRRAATPFRESSPQTRWRAAPTTNARPPSACPIRAWRSQRRHRPCWRRANNPCSRSRSIRRSRACRTTPSRGRLRAPGRCGPSRRNRNNWSRASAASAYGRARPRPGRTGSRRPTPTAHCVPRRP